MLETAFESPWVFVWARSSGSSSALKSEEQQAIHGVAQAAAPIAMSLVRAVSPAAPAMATAEPLESTSHLTDRSMHSRVRPARYDRSYQVQHLRSKRRPGCVP